MEMYAVQWGSQSGRMQDGGEQLLQFKEKRNAQELGKSRLKQESPRTETDLDERAKHLLKSAIRLSNEITQYRRHLLDINSPKTLEEETLLNNKAVFNALLARGVLGPMVEMEETP